MKKIYSISCLALIVLLSGCSIFKPGCHCPKVSYSTHKPEKMPKNS
jgi:hypothetical protein